MEEEQSQQPLLSRRNSGDDLSLDSGDIEPINGAKQFFGEFYVEWKKLWSIAGLIIFTTLCQYSTGALTQVFTGQLGTLELAAVSVQNSVIAGFAFGIMLGMGSALETLCGQAYGAGQMEMLGIYMQRSWIILNLFAIPLLFLYIFTTPILKLIGQSPKIADWAGKFSIWMIPELFAFAFYFPMQKFLQAQSKVVAMALIGAGALIFHVAFSWWFIFELGFGLVGAAVVYNVTWVLQVVAYLCYVLWSCRDAWSGFSWKAFHSLWSFLRLSLASAVMLCLEIWYFMALILFAGYLKNSEIAVDALSVCMTILVWTVNISLGFNAAVSVRVSNELGAGHPRAAKFSVVVATVTSFMISICFALLLMLLRKQYPALFSSSVEVQELVYELTPLLTVSVITDSIQPVLSGVAIGAGWQVSVAYVNIACYYIFGIPLGLVLGFVLDMGVQGIWYGMISGTVLQTIVIFMMIYKTNWNKEASIAGDRIKEWGGERDGGLIN